MGPLGSQLRYDSLLLALLPTARIAAQQLSIAGIARVGYRVSDADKAQAFYTGVPGFPRVHESPSGAAIYKVSHHQYIEISPGLSPGKMFASLIFRSKPRTCDCFGGLLRSRGLRATAPVRDARGNLSISLESPEGTRIEFVEYRPSSPERADRGKFLDSPRISSHLQHAGVIVERGQLGAVLHFCRDGLECTEFCRYEPAPGD